MFILASSLCWSFQCLISPRLKGVCVVTYLHSLVQLCFGEGGTLQTNITGMCGECLQCMSHTGFAQAHGLCFLVLHCSGCGVLCRTLSKAGPGFHALLRSNPLGFRFSGTPQGTDSVGHAFCALPRSEQLRRPGA